jgi:hypothetical protein
MGHNGSWNRKMRGLPFAFTQGSELAQAVRLAAQDPARRMVCDTCGGRIPLHRGAAGTVVRCPHCWRDQRVARVQEESWRLSAEAAEALKRTRRWLRDPSPGALRAPTSPAEPTAEREK